jgi:2-oxoglutarate ferredoxin oxidoreductase subunit alpha
MKPDLPLKTWALGGCRGREPNVVKSLFMGEGELELLNYKLAQKYRNMIEREVKYQEYMTDDASLIVVAFGISARIAYSAVRRLRGDGRKVGLFRPISLYPFPERRLNGLAGGSTRFLTVELNMGQMVEDVRLAVNGKSEVLFYGKPGGSIITPEDLYDKISGML